MVPGNTYKTILYGCLLLLLLGACVRRAEPSAGASTASNAPVSTAVVQEERSATATPTGASPAERPAPDATVAPESVPAETLRVSLMYPTDEVEVEKGQSIKLTARVADGEGAFVDDAVVAFTVRGPDRESIATLEGEAGNEGLYRTAYWPLPNTLEGGEWALTVEASRGAATARAESVLHVRDSTSDRLLSSYGFWLDAPAVGGIDPSIIRERGDARNGMIMWGGTRPAMHLLPQVWVEVHWRTGDSGLDSDTSVQNFMLETLGDIGFTPIRTVGPFAQTRFKEWDAWKGDARGTVKQDDLEWVLFYAPEVDRTYAIGTTVANMPNAMALHDTLRASFRVDPDVTTTGVAPEPLETLLGAPELVSPAMGARFEGASEPIILRWNPVKELEEDEYYEVAVDYDYNEDSITLQYMTRDTQFTIPEELYREPNCRYYNWRITLKRQTGINSQGEIVGERVSYGSLYSYFEWLYPADEERQFAPICPNHQI